MPELCGFGGAERRRPGGVDRHGPSVCKFARNLLPSLVIFVYILWLSEDIMYAAHEIVRSVPGFRAR